MAAGIQLADKPKGVLLLRGTLKCVCTKSLPLKVSVAPAGFSSGHPSLRCKSCDTRFAVSSHIKGNIVLVGTWLEAIHPEQMLSPVEIHLMELDDEDEG